MQGVLLGFVLIWVSSFLIFAWMIWRAPIMEELLDDGEPADTGARGHEQPGNAQTA